MGFYLNKIIYNFTMLSQLARNVRKVRFNQIVSTNKAACRNQSDFSLNEEIDAIVKDFDKEMYINKVTLCGRVCWSPRELKRRDTQEYLGINLVLPPKSL